jgi:predicted NUDIX family NTP pyrophosphohydrolase
MPLQTLAQAAREAGIILTPSALAEVAVLDAHPMGPMNPTGPVGWCAPLEGGLTFQASYDMASGWTVEVVETEPEVGRQLPYEVRKSAEALSDALADYWRGDLHATLYAIGARLVVLDHRNYAEHLEQIWRLAAGLYAVTEEVGPGGWFPVADCKLSADDLAALWSCGVLKVFPRVEAGSYCIEFESAAVLSGRRSS